MLQALVSGALLGCFYALVASGFALTLSVTRALNLAHGEMIVAGGYLGYWLWAGSGLGPLWLMPVAAAALLPMGWGVHALLRRLPEPRELTSLTAGFGVALLLQDGMRALWGSDYRLIADSALTASLRLGPISLNRGRLAAALAALAVIAVLWVALTRTRWGRAARATALDEEAAALLGINTDLTGRTTLLLSAALAGASGVLFATLHYVHPAGGGPLVMVSIVLALWAGIGRMRSLLAAGVALGLVETLGVAWLGPGWRETLVAAVLLFTLLARGGSLARGMTAGGHAG